MINIVNRLSKSVQFACGVFTVIAAMLFACIELNAQCAPATTHTSGLQLPIKMIQSQKDNLLVAESGTPTPNTGRISIVDSYGIRRTLISNLPSGINEVGEVSGPNGLYMRGRTLYVLIGQGDATLAGPVPGTEIPNSNPSSPIFDSVLAIHFSTNVEKRTDGFSLSLADQEALKNGEEVRIDNGHGDKITIELIADFPNFVPSPLPFFADNVRHSNPYDLVAIGNELYVVDAGLNSVRVVDINTGEYSTLTEFPPIQNPLPFGGPVVEAVPTSIQTAGNELLVTLLRGFPFPPGTSQVINVDPDNGDKQVFIEGLSSAIDVLPFNKKGKGNSYLTLEFSSNFLASEPGRLQLWTSPSSSPSVISNCLVTPTSMVLDEKSKNLYVTSLATGTIVKIQIQ
jgi:hypothetical protein